MRMDMVSYKYGASHLERMRFRMDRTAIFKLTYGLFFIGTKSEESENICVINTAAQVTQTPLRISVTMLKSGYTHDLIQKSGQFSLGIMGRSASMDAIAHFGQLTGRSTDKLSGWQIERDSLGNPQFSQGCIATLSGKVVQSLDLGTHTLFIADVVDGASLSDEQPLTYADYRVLKAGGSLSGGAAPKPKAAYQCTICHYVYDGEIPFEELPDDWVCPVCGKPKSVFAKM